MNRVREIKDFIRRIKNVGPFAVSEGLNQNILQQSGNFLFHKTVSTKVKQL